jgi:hypothetical protein
MEQIREGSFVEVKHQRSAAGTFQGKVGRVVRLLEGEFALVRVDGRSRVFALDELVRMVWSD